MVTLVHGTEQEHLDTIARAKANGVDSIWTGDIRRNAYLRENLAFAQERNLVKITQDENYEGQESYLELKWL